MTTELAIADSFEPVPLTTSILEDLKQQAETLHAAHTVAEWLCGTGFAPEAYRNKPKEGAVAILFGARLGLDAVQSLQNVFNVYGVPSTYAKVMKAAVLAAGHEIWTVEKSATRCVVRGRRRGSDPNLPPEESVWDTERVKKAGYDKRNQKYNTESENMLYARATAECCRAVAPDVLLGIDVDIEEVRDRGRDAIRVESERVPVAEISHTSATAAPVVQQWQPPAAAEESAKPDNAQVEDSAKASPEPSAEPAPAKKAPGKRAATKRAEPEPGKITPAQLEEAAALFTRAGITDRADNREFLAAMFGRPVEDPRTLTEADGEYLLEQLRTLPPAGGEQLPTDGENAGEQ